MMGARAEALLALRADFVAGRGSLHELAQAAGFRVGDIVEEIARDDWYGRRSRVQRGEPGDYAVAPTAEQRCARILAALEEVARSWSDMAAQDPGRVKPLEVRAMVHVVGELLDTDRQLRRDAATEAPPPRRFSLRSPLESTDSVPLRADHDSRYA